jgi:putative flippase GtrA
MLNKIWKFSGIRFVAVGVVNTIVDFGILNILVFVFGLNNIIANTISVSVAMTISYLLNHKVVFRQQGKYQAQKFIIFIVITAFGLFVVQNLVIYLLVHVFTWPAELLTSFLHSIGLDNLSQEFVTLNFAKVMATGVTMVWNYFMYRKYVFVDSHKTKESGLD